MATVIRGFFFAAGLAFPFPEGLEVLVVAGGTGATEGRLGMEEEGDEEGRPCSWGVLSSSPEEP